MVYENLMTVLDENCTDNSVKLPHTYLEKIIELNHSPPFYFTIISEVGTSIKVSVKEFTSDLGTIVLSEQSLDNLCIHDNHIVSIELISDKIPKGKMIRLTPKSMDFFSIPEYDTILEHELSKYSMVYNDQQICLTIFDKKYIVLVDNVEPDWELMDKIRDTSIIDIVDIDLKVDINNEFLEEQKKMEEEQKKMEEDHILQQVAKIKNDIKEEFLKRKDEELKAKEKEDQRHKEELKTLKEKFLSRFS